MSNELSTMMAGADLAAAMGFSADTAEIFWPKPCTYGAGTGSYYA